MIVADNGQGFYILNIRYYLYSNTLNYSLFQERVEQLEDNLRLHLS